MITSASIDELIQTLDIVEVISQDLTLNKKGATFSACCPFHSEKSPSFSVSKPKQIFKCFGCGVSGDAVAFIMLKHDLEFIPAIRLLASRINFTLEETEQTQEEKELAIKKTDFWKLNKSTANFFSNNILELPADHWVLRDLFNKRKYQIDTILEWNLGYARSDRRALCEKITEAERFYQGEEIGLVKTNDNGATRDVFRNRLMFPILNDQGHIVGFGGRKPSDDKNKENPKYINSKESPIYQKDRVLYGLYQAKRHIKEMGYAVIVEGYTDVISMHESEIRNTVAPCGTALTTHQAKLIKRYTNKVVLMADGDAAGSTANLKSVNTLLKESLQVEICPLPEKQDPDSFSRELVTSYINV